MSTTGTDIENELDDLELGEDQPELPLGTAAPDSPPTEEETPDQKEIKRLTSERDAAIAAGSKNEDKMGALLDLGRQFLEKQKTEAAPTPQTSDADYEAWGKKIQELAISGDPKDFAKTLVSAFSQIAANQTDSTLRQYGTPLVERSADFASQAFLSHKGDQLGPNAEKTHNLVKREFKLDDRERAWLGTANNADAQTFLENKYKQVAGDILLRSSQKARPKNIDAGAGGGGSKGGSTTSAFPGVDARRARELERLAEEWWPDEAVRKKKLELVRAEMAQEG